MLFKKILSKQARMRRIVKIVRKNKIPRNQPTHTHTLCTACETKQRSKYSKNHATTISNQSPTHHLRICANEENVLFPFRSDLLL